jgi:hypothetical protein
MTNPIVVTLEGAVRRLIGSMNIMVEPSTSFFKPLKPITELLTMKNEIEKKKEYITPKMEVIDMGDDTVLLQGSCVGNDNCFDAIFKKDDE